MPALTLKFAVIALAAVVILIAMGRSAKRPNRSRQHPGRYRMPIVVPVIGWLLTAVGFVLGLAAFSFAEADGVWPMRAVTVVIFCAGLLLVLAYRNRFIEAGAESVRFRTVAGRERTIAFADIVESRVVERGRRRMLVVRSRSGELLRIDLRVYPVPSLVAVLGREGSGVERRSR